MEFVLATRNAHKVEELAELLPGHALRGLPDALVMPPESADTFAGNALIKARAAATELGCAAIADDSGICAEALGGRPGVRSARFAGEHATDQQNLELFTAQVPVGSAIAYVCVIAVVLAGGEEFTVEGRCEGTMAPEPRGTGGFGYDPIFLPRDADGRTMAQLTAAEKGAISHRGVAARALATALTERGLQ